MEPIIVIDSHFATNVLILCLIFLAGTYVVNR